MGAPAFKKIGSAAALVLAGALSCAPTAGWAEAAARKISRAEVLQLGVEHNLDLFARRLEHRKLDAHARAALRAYSPTLLADTRYADYQVARGTPGQARHLEYSVGASWKAPIGTQLSTELKTDRSLFGEAEPHGAAISLGLTQPLLKDGWLDGAALPLREAHLDALAQRESYRAELNRFLLELETAYWDLALAQSDLALKRRSLERAKAQHDDTRENIRRGIIADAEIYLVEENVVIFRQDLLRAEQGLTLAQRRLAELLLLDPGTALEAADPLAARPQALPQRQAFVALGAQRHPRVLAQQLKSELALARVRHQRNQALPSLGLSASLALRGWDGPTGAAWSQAFGSPEPDARVGLSLALPLDRAAVRANLEEAELEAERQSALLQKEATSVRFELENAFTDLEANQQLLTLAQKQVELAELKLKAQYDKYQSGLSTLADVVRFQRDLDVATGAHQRVMRAVQVGQVKLYASQGTLIDQPRADGR